MTTGCSARIFPALSFSAFVLAARLQAGAPDLAAYRANPTPVAAAELTAYANLHAKEQAGALANFALGIAALQQKNYGLAIQHLTAARPFLPRLEDYVVFHLAKAKSETADFSGVAQDLAALRGKLSPLGSKAAVMEANALAANRDYLTAIAVLRERFESLPQPEAALLLARAYEGQGETSQAAALYQRVYYTHPATPQAVDAAEAIERLKKSMGKDYPPPSAAQTLIRGDRWLEAKQYAKAKLEFQEMTQYLGGVERDKAAVRMGAADVLGGNVAGARRYLDGLRLGKGEADAERFFYSEEAARKTTDDPGVRNALQQLEKRYPESPWRLKALVAAGNGYVSARQPERAVPLFRAASATFPPDPITALCHWRVAWNEYLNRSPEAASLMQEQASRYPNDQRAASALYFLGRLAEEARDFSTARAYFERLQEAFPHYYYGTLGTERLAGSEIASATADPALSQSLSRIAFPAKLDWTSEGPTAATQARIDRARLLTAAGFPDWAESEIRFGASMDGQRPLLALELAKSDATLARGLRHMKLLTPEYLVLDYAQAPKEVWGYLFPLPLRDELVKIAKAKDLDPYLVAGLIRQESEFNPVVVSHANAFGWMQLLPSTGRMLARQEGMPAFQTKMLFDPLVSMKLGVSYLRAQLEKWNGSVEQTLAAYNAGPGRVQQWTAGVQFREPAEFIESIPFTETREYVQSVLRNAMVYRQLYASKNPPPQPANALTSTHADASRPAPAAPRPVAGGKRPVKRKRSS